MKELIFFSYNQHKITEIKKILENTRIKILTLNDFPKIDEPEENKETFTKNAIIKSNFGFQKFNIPCFSDDSGICISALNNQPGVRSKRFQERLYG